MKEFNSLSDFYQYVRLENIQLVKCFSRLKWGIKDLNGNYYLCRIKEDK